MLRSFLEKVKSRAPHRPLLKYRERDHRELHRFPDFLYKFKHWMIEALLFIFSMKEWTMSAPFFR